jgi:hypothetical protein
LFLEQRRALARSEEMESVWDGKRKACEGTPIPDAFPYRSQLISHGYLVLEEIRGADARELSRAGLTSAQAAAVLAAIG